MERKPVIDQLQHEARVLQGEAAKDRTYSSERTFSTAAEARAAFARSVSKLYDVQGWSAISSITADFKRYDAAGRLTVSGPVQEGNYICIVLPGPMPESWVQVIAISTTDIVAAFTVQPCHDPTGDKPEQIRHFFNQEARSTFQVELDGTTLRAAEIGQHEAINNQQPEAGDRALINTVIAEAGWLFYQKIQWQKLTDYLVEA